MSSGGSSAASRGIAAVVGVGPRLGCSIARKFAHEGYTVAILARDLARLSRLAEEIARKEKAQVFAIRIDCADTRSVSEAFEGVLSLGFVEVLVYNAHHTAASPPGSSGRDGGFHHIPLQSFHASLAVSALAAFQCAQLVLPGMVERGRGTILFTGCSTSLAGLAGYSDICCGKFALRALSQCLAREFQPQGVHVAHVVIDGVIGEYSSSTTGRRSSMAQTSRVGEDDQEMGEEMTTVITMEADAVAQTYWQLHVQDRTAWTQEMDLRP